MTVNWMIINSYNIFLKDFHVDFKYVFFKRKLIFVKIGKAIKILKILLIALSNYKRKN